MAEADAENANRDVHIEEERKTNYDPYNSPSPTASFFFCFTIRLKPEISRICCWSRLSLGNSVQAILIFLLITCCIGFLFLFFGPDTLSIVYIVFTILCLFIQIPFLVMLCKKKPAATSTVILFGKLNYFCLMIYMLLYSIYSIIRLFAMGPFQIVYSLLFLGIYLFVYGYFAYIIFMYYQWLILDEVSLANYGLPPEKQEVVSPAAIVAVPIIPMAGGAMQGVVMPPIQNYQGSPVIGQPYGTIPLGSPYSVYVQPYA